MALYASKNFLQLLLKFEKIRINFKGLFVLVYFKGSSIVLYIAPHEGSKTAEAINTWWQPQLKQAWEQRFW